MIFGAKQEEIDVSGNNSKFVGGDDHSKVYNVSGSKQTRLSILFDILKAKFDQNDTITEISRDLTRYLDQRDTIGLEQKLIDANRSHLYEDFSWLKEEFSKKLTIYQFFEPAQEILSFILGVVFEKFRNIIYPMIRNNDSEKEILEKISSEIVNPIVSLIQEQGCNDIMGLSSVEVEGMVHFLTGRCHIRWNL